MDDIVDRLREHLIRRDTRVSTHWDGCIDTHPLCALAWALDEVEHLRVVLSEWQKTVQHLTALAAERDAEIERMRGELNDCENDFEALSQILNKVKAERDQMKSTGDEIERLRTEVLELRGVVRAHEGLYARAAEEIDKQRGWIERTYRMAVGHGPNWKVFDSWEQAINAYEEARRG